MGRSEGAQPLVLYAAQTIEPQGLHMEEWMSWAGDLGQRGWHEERCHWLRWHVQPVKCWAAWTWSQAFAGLEQAPSQAQPLLDMLLSCPC